MEEGSVGGFVLGVFMGWVNVCELGSSDLFSWEFLNVPLLGDLEEFLILKLYVEALGLSDGVLFI